MRLPSPFNCCCFWSSFEKSPQPRWSNSFEMNAWCVKIELISFTAFVAINIITLQSPDSLHPVSMCLRIMYHQLSGHPFAFTAQRTRLSFSDSLWRPHGVIEHLCSPRLTFSGKFSLFCSFVHLQNWNKAGKKFNWYSSWFNYFCGDFLSQWKFMKCEVHKTKSANI